MEDRRGRIEEEYIHDFLPGFVLHGDVRCVLHGDVRQIEIPEPFNGNDWYLNYSRIVTSIFSLFHYKQHTDFSTPTIPLSYETLLNSRFIMIQGTCPTTVLHNNFTGVESV